MIKSAIIAAAIVGLAAPAFAEPAEVIVIKARAIGTLAGRAALQRDVEEALEHFCGSYAAIEKDQWRAIDECRDDARIEIRTRLAKLNGADGEIRLASR